MADQENRDSLQTDSQKPSPPKQQFPSGEPKSPQPEQEKHDKEKKQA
jgi:hypothetical protein